MLDLQTIPKDQWAEVIAEKENTIAKEIRDPLRYHRALEDFRRDIACQIEDIQLQEIRTLEDARWLATQKAIEAAEREVEERRKPEVSNDG